jgi:WD40 repeat protein
MRTPFDDRWFDGLLGAHLSLTSDPVGGTAPELPSARPGLAAVERVRDWGEARADDGQTIAACGRDGTIRLWKADGRLLTTIDSRGGGSSGSALSPDGRLIAGGGCDGTLRVWAVSSGQPVASAQHHRGV